MVGGIVLTGLAPGGGDGGDGVFDIIYILSKIIIICE
jgi:hypothetical protein